MNALTAPTLANTVLWTARRFGYPRVTMLVPGRASAVQVAPTPDAWARTIALFRSNDGVLRDMFQQLIDVDLELHRDVGTGAEVASDGA